MDNILFQQSQSIDEIKNRLNCIETGDLSDGVGHADSGHINSRLILDQTKLSLLADNEFVSGIVDNIMTNSNLSEIIEQIDTVQTENRELRELLHAQQKTINEMNVMLLKLISQSLTQPAPGPAVVPVAAPVPVLVPVAASVPESESESEDDSSGENNIQMDVIDASTNMQSVD